MDVIGAGWGVLGHPQGHLVGDHVPFSWHCFVVMECAHNDVDEVGLAGM